MPESETLEVRLMTEVDGRYHAFYLARGGRVIARLSAAGFEYEGVRDEDERQLAENVLRGAARMLGAALEGVLLARGALWRRREPGQPAAFPQAAPSMPS